MQRKWIGCFLAALAVGCAGYSIHYEPSSPPARAKSKTPLPASAGIVCNDHDLATEFKTQLEAARIFQSVDFLSDIPDRPAVVLEVQSSTTRQAAGWDPTAEGAEVVFTFGLAALYITHVFNYETKGLLLARIGDSWSRSYPTTVRAESRNKIRADSQSEKIAAEAMLGLRRRVSTQLIAQLLRDKDVLAAEISATRAPASRSAPSASTHQ